MIEELSTFFGRRNVNPRDLPAVILISIRLVPLPNSNHRLILTAQLPSLSRPGAMQTYATTPELTATAQTRGAKRSNGFDGSYDTSKRPSSISARERTTLSRGASARVGRALVERRTTTPTIAARAISASK